MLGYNGRQMKGDKGRQVNLSAWRAVPGIQAGRQRETNEGRQRETSESVRREPCQASRLGLGNRRATLNEFRNPHSKLFRELKPLLRDGSFRPQPGERLSLE